MWTIRLLVTLFHGEERLGQLRIIYGASVYSPDQTAENGRRHSGTNKLPSEPLADGSLRRTINRLFGVERLHDGRNWSDLRKLTLVYRQNGVGQL